MEINAADRFLFGMATQKFIVTVVHVDDDRVVAIRESGATTVYPRFVFESMVARKL